MNRVTAVSSLVSTTTDLLDRSPDEAAWDSRAACREPDAPSMFADDWGVGRPGRRRRAAALAVCRRCPVRWKCGVRALLDVENGLSLYGVRCGIEFTDVTPSRQQRDIERLRAVVAGIDPSDAGRPRLVEAGHAASRRTVIEVRRQVRSGDAATVIRPEHAIALEADDPRDELILQAG